MIKMGYLHLQMCFSCILTFAKMLSLMNLKKYRKRSILCALSHDVTIIPRAFRLTVALL